MTKDTEAQDIVSKCRESLPLKDDVLNDLVLYVNRYVYFDVRSSLLEMARVSKWKGNKKKSMTRLLPDFDSLKQQRHPKLRIH